MPALARGRAKAGKSMEGFEIVGPSFVVTGNDEAEMAAAESGTRQQIAFYGSTPAYKGVLELHGWNGLHEELNALSKKGGWVEMGNLIMTRSSTRSPWSPSPSRSRPSCCAATAT